MKILLITALFVLMLAAWVIGMDLVLNIDVKRSLKVVLNPFFIMEPFEAALFIILLLFAAGSPLYRKYQRKKK